MKASEEDLRKILSIPPTYKVLFLEGGAHHQFSAIPMNLLGGEKKEADYVVTGTWSKKAFDEVNFFTNVGCVTYRIRPRNSAKLTLFANHLNSTRFPSRPHGNHSAPMLPTFTTPTTRPLRVLSSHSFLIPMASPLFVICLPTSSPANSM